ncbi:MAG: stage sporulation protein, partial [Clostridiales bacterium]|nr:stage sporulation protein [Clostridiales bacterium]
KYGTICVLFYSLSTVTNSILQGMGKVNIPVKNAAISLLGHVAVLIPLLYFTNLDVYALLIGTALYSFFMCLLNGYSVKKITGYRQDIKKTFLLPAVSALIMGILVYVTYYSTYILLQRNVLSLFLSIFLGIITYFAALLKLKGVTEEELKRFPKGTLLIRVAKKTHLLN